MKLTIGFSPCPNDTFIFDAMIHGKIDTEGLEFEVVMKDVEELNRMAFNNLLNITKLSFHAFAHLTNDYILLNSGSALGNKCGPLVISKTGKSEELSQGIIGIPGKYTTANLLFSIRFPEVKNKQELLFSAIENAILSETIDAGVIIHENRFTYQDKGLKKVIDLGEFWEKTTGYPIPLGGIAGQRTLDPATLQKVNRIIKRSIEFAFSNRESSKEFIKRHAQEMDEDVIKQHINLYVNDYSLDLGERGKQAVVILFEKAIEASLITSYNKKLFIQ